MNFAWIEAFMKRWIVPFLVTKKGQLDTSFLQFIVVKAFSGPVGENLGLIPGIGKNFEASFNSIIVKYLKKLCKAYNFIPL